MGVRMFSPIFRIVFASVVPKPRTHRTCEMPASQGALKTDPYPTEATAAIGGAKDASRAVASIVGVADDADLTAWFAAAKERLRTAFTDGAIDAETAKQLAIYLAVLEEVGVEVYDAHSWQERQAALLVVGIDIDELRH